VLGIVSIFTYGLQKGIDRLAAANVENTSLSNYNALVAVAHETGYIAESDIKKLEAFQKNPSDESWQTL
ncbi:MAG: orotate phosphoribosyltransferase, partial [Butyricicoccaceae bacterium]